MDEETKTGEMTGLGEDEDITTIEEDYTALESDTVIVDDDSNVENNAAYNQAVEYKDNLDDVREQLKEKLLAILEKGEISNDDSSEIELLQEQYTENYTALKVLAAENDVSTSDTSEVVVNGDIDYDKLMSIISEKADWLYIDEDGTIMLNGEAVPKLKVMELEAEKIKTDLLEAQEAIIEKATITDLEATNANITNLTALVAEIQTLVGGNLSMDNIQSLVLTADKVTIADALIKDAMIETISANKINTGTINTNNVSIQSEDGSMLINGTTQQFKDENNTVRIQIGKDAEGNFTFCLFSQDGVGILLDETGIHAGAVPNGLIVNDMVSDDANISGGKLDISSVISSINDNVNTINSSKIYFDDKSQTLDVAFNQLQTQVDTIESITVDGDLSTIIEQVNTNTTNIEIAQGQISSLISNTTITKENGTVTQLKDEFNSVKDTVSSHTQTINSLETTLDTVSAKQTEFTQDLDGFKTTVSSTYTTKTELDELNIGTRNLLLRTDESKTLTGDGTENQCIDLFSISDPTLLAGKTATLSFKYTLSDWSSEGGIKLQTGYTTYDSFEQVWFWANGTFEYVSTITFSETNADTALQLRADWLNGTVTVLANTAILVISDKKADWTPAPEDLKNSISTVEQTASKIEWIVGSGTNKSDMTLTDEAYELISQNVNITADRINLNGYVSNEDSNWSINEQGDIEAKNLSVEEELSTDVLNVNTINNPRYPATLASSIDISVSSLTGSDDWTLDEVLASIDESEEQGSADLIKKFATLKGVYQALPKDLNGKTVRIYLETTDPGQVLFSYLYGGRILIFLNSQEVQGYLGFYNCTAECKIYGGSSTSAPDTKAVIKPSTSTYYTSSSDYCSVFISKCPVSAVYYTKIYGASNTTGYTSIKVTEDCKCRIESCDFASAYCFVNTSSCCDVYVNTSTGLAANYAFKAYTGSVLTLGNNTQANGVTGNAYWSNGSVIFGSLSQTIVGNYNITWDSSSTQESNNSTATANTTNTVTYKSTLGDTYRTTYSSWKKDGTCRQGSGWGSGNCTGVWFFGTQFSELKGKTITKVTVTITRQSSANGNNTAVEHKLYMHNYSTRPSGAPTLNSAWNTTFTLTRGQSKTITITDSTVLNAIKAGTCKGFGIRHTYDSSHYSVCSGSATVKITYKE